MLLAAVLLAGLPEVRVEGRIVEEGDRDLTSVHLAVTLSAPADTPIGIDYATEDATARAPDDYVFRQGTLVFAPGVTAQTVTVRVRGDVAAEPCEALHVVVRRAGVLVAAATILIANDDAPPSADLPTVEVEDVEVLEGDGPRDVGLALTLSSAPAAPVTVPWDLLAGTAQPDADFVTDAGLVTFAPGEQRRMVSVHVQGDAVPEPAETIVLNLGEPTGAARGRAQATLTLLDDDGEPEVSVEGGEVTEGGEVVSLPFTVTLSAPPRRPVHVTWRTGEGTAQPGIDYVDTAGQLTLEPGTTAAALRVSVLPDAVPEGPETVSLVLTSATGASLGEALAFGRIHDDAGGPEIAIANLTILEPRDGPVTAHFEVTLSAPSSLPVAVDYATAPGSALDPRDFSAAMGTLTVAPGETSGRIPVTIHPDREAEAPEVFTMELNRARGGSLAREHATGTIDDPDSDPALSLWDATVTEADDAIVPARFTVALSGARSRPVWVDWQTVGGTATPAIDYGEARGTVSFPPGQTVQVITVSVLPDRDEERHEFFEVELVDPHGATLRDPRGTGTVRDNDRRRARPDPGEDAAEPD